MPAGYCMTVPAGIFMLIRCYPDRTCMVSA